VEHSARRRYDFDALITIVAGLEALLNTGRRQNTKQFVQRAPDLATELGASGVSRAMARRLYDNRSEPAHGRRLSLVPGPRPGQPPPDFDQVLPQALRELALLQDLLRSAVRRCIEDPAFAQHFASDESVRAKWPVDDGKGNEL
jgi:hypothetical protein